MKKVLLWGLSIVFGLSLILVLLLNAADSVAFNLNQYYKGYEKYDRPEYIGISMDDLMDVTEHLLDYMKGRQPDLIMEKEIDGVNQEVFGERERSHMVDVRRLVLGAMNIRLWCGILAALSLAGIILWKKKAAPDWLSRGYLWALAGFGLVFAALAVYFLVDFSGAFWNFHLLFFDNDLWLLDPVTDVMINMFPEEFFNDMTLSIVGRALMFIVLPAIAGIVWLRREKINARSK